MAEPRVSVIVPVYNAEQTIGPCIESLLDQDFPKDRLEIIVVDNKSTDGTKDRVQRYDVKYTVEREIQTSYAARNRGIREAVGEVLAFTDADCVADRNWLKAGLELFRDPAVGGVGGKVLAYKPETYIERYQERRGEMNQKRHFTAAQGAGRPVKIITCNAFYRREIFGRVGLFNPDLVSGGDYDLSLRVQAETNYLLAYAEDAVVQHKHRSSLLEFWKQYYKYGIGRLYLATQYNPQAVRESERHGYLRPLYWQLRSIAPHLMALVSQGLRYTVTWRPEAKQKMADAFLDAVRMTAFYSGNLRSSITQGKPYFE